MPEVISNIINDSEQKDAESTIQTCRQILKDCKNDLDKFPSKGAHYFSFPEPQENIKVAIANLPEQEIHNLFYGWQNTDLKERLVNEYGDRTFGYFLINLFPEKIDLVEKEVGNSIVGLFKKILDKPNDETILKMHEMSKLRFYLPKSNQEHFTEHLDNALADLKSIYQNTKIDDIIPYQSEGMEIIASLNLFKSGIIDGDLLYDKDPILLALNREHLDPLEAMYEKEKINEDRDEDTLSNIALFTVIAEVMNGKEIDSEKFSLINKEESKLLVPMLYIKLVNIKTENLAPGVRKIMDETEITTEDALGLLQGLIITESEINSTSFLYKKLQTIDLSQADLGNLINAALNIHNGDWNKVDPFLKDIIEKSFLNKNLRSGEIIDILSATIELNCKLPDFLKLAFEKPENQEALLKNAFNFRIRKPINKYGASWCFYKNIKHNILTKGFSAFPEPVRKFYSENADNMGTKAREILLSFVFPKYCEDLDVYNLINTTGNVVENYDHKLYDLISKDVWDVLKTSSIKDLSDFFRYSSNMIAGVIYHGEQERAENKILIPAEHIMPPDMIDNITKKIFPNWKIEKSSLENLDILNFIITEEMLVNFSETDRNFLKFCKKFPKASIVLFDYKDKYFAENISEKEVVTSKMILELIGKIPHKESKTLTAVYMDINKDNLDFDFLKIAINHRFFPPEYSIKYIKNNETYTNVYQKLYEQSGSQEWIDLIPDRDIYWESNSMLLINLLEMGLNDIDFNTFRMLGSNPNVIDVFNDLGIKIDSLTNLGKQISINPHNFSYINLESISLLQDKFTLTNNPKTQGFFRRLLSEQPRSFNNAVGALSKNKEIDISNDQIQEQVFSVIRKIGNVSPMVLKCYINENDSIKKEEFLLKIKTIKEHFLLNEPVKDILSELGYGNEVLAELITLAFPGTNLKDVEGQLTQLDDRCEDLVGFSINKNGYIPTIKQQFKTAVLKDGEDINNILLDDLKEMFPRSLSKQLRSEYKNQLEKSLIFALRTRGAFNFNELNKSIPAILSIMYDEEPVQEFRKTSFDFSQPENVTTFLSRVTELLGIYFKDNFEGKLLETLEKNPELSKQLQSNISQQFINQTSKNMGKVNDNQEKSNFQNIINNLSNNIINKTPIDNQDMAKLITFMLEHRILRGEKGLRTQIKKEYKKFNFITTDKSTLVNETPQFKGFVSKNIASFFAKTSAGICTAGDITLFNRKDHFHINMVNNETIVGNIQGYTIEYEGKKALLFRGFNPSVAFVNPNNADMIAEGMVSLVNKFALENSISDVFIAEQTNWHSLTNRVGEGILKYFQNNYIKPDREVKFTFPVTGNQNISKMYRIN